MDSTIYVSVFLVWMWFFRNQVKRKKNLVFFRNFANVLSTTLNISHHIPHSITATFTYSLILAIFASHLRGVTVVAIYIRLFLFDPFTECFFSDWIVFKMLFFRFLWTNNISFKFHFKTSDYKIFDYFFGFFENFMLKISRHKTDEHGPRIHYTNTRFILACAIWLCVRTQLCLITEIVLVTKLFLEARIFTRRNFF